MKRTTFKRIRRPSFTVEHDTWELFVGVCHENNTMASREIVKFMEKYLEQNGKGENSNG